MFQRDVIILVERYGHHIKANVCIRLPRTMKINNGRVTNLLDFPGGDRFGRCAESRSLLAAAPYFYDDKRIPFAGDNVNLPRAAAPISLYHGKPVRQQVLTGGLFRFAAAVFSTVCSSLIYIEITQRTTLFPPFYRIDK